MKVLSFRMMMSHLDYSTNLNGINLHQPFIGKYSFFRERHASTATIRKAYGVATLVSAASHQVHLHFRLG